VRDPEATLNEVSESAIREIVGTNKLDFVLTEGRAEISAATRELIQGTLDDYGTGLQVTSVNLQETNFPTQVQASVQDAIKAREDRDRLALEAQAYANDVLPRARGNAARQIQDAEAYRERVVADAQGEAARFEALLAEYRKAPDVTRERLYLETIEQVYGSTNKVFIDAKDSGNLLYLPLDQLLKGAPATALREMSAPEASTATRTSSGSADRRSRDESRSRGTR
jgi:membrane protease subunit HflK